MPALCSSRKSEADGLVLDLETAVKDGILGEVRGSRVVGEKQDLSKTISQVDFSDAPSVFICPISLEPMQDPVTLCTGQTYDRSNITKWLSLGRFTCPTTMQELWDDSLTPNTTLQHLINSWFAHKHSQAKKRAEDVRGVTIEFIDALKRAKGRARVQFLKELRRQVETHSTARKAVTEEGGVVVVCSLLGRFTSHAVGSEAIAILANVALPGESVADLVRPEKLSLIADILREGSAETKINCARLIEIIMEEKRFHSELASSHAMLSGLTRLIKDKRCSNKALTAVRVLRTVSSYESCRGLMVSVGAIPSLVESVGWLEGESLEGALCVVEGLSRTAEGRAAMREAGGVVPTMVRVLMRVSETCTRHALSILWCVCEGNREWASVAVEAGVVAKLLLVMQSGCGEMLKHRSAQLLKICRMNYSDAAFISKCKLTSTIQ